MYHTFQSGTASEAGQRASAAKRISTPNACSECRRRKIRCDGGQPCAQCEWYHRADACSYNKGSQRLVPSRKLVDRLHGENESFRVVVARIFPDQDLDRLATLTREQLINLALSLPAATTSPASQQFHEQDFSKTSKSDGAESLEALEKPPDLNPKTDEAKHYTQKIQAISDDVNGLSLSVDKPASYVGVSSITAALKVIFKTAPVARPFIMQTYNDTALPSRSNTPPLHSNHHHHPDPNYLPPADVGHKLIESYFNHVHVLMPMVDEDQLWHTYLYGERRDSPWLALLNMVFALGLLASGTCDNEDHIAYFQRARKHLDIEAFRSSNLLVLHALGLLSGYYLHWLNRPNEANCMMGATLRMATTLGLHREYTGDSQAAASTNNHYSGGGGSEIPVEIRRRTWWSLFCLDALAQMTTGRPSLGRMGPGITAQKPKIPDQMNNAQYLASIKLLPVINNIPFCKLATRIQDKLSNQSLLPPEELFSLDAELTAWNDELPPILRDGTTAPNARSFSVSPASLDSPLSKDKPAPSCPEVLITPRCIMHWWYQTLRMLMHRPYVLVAALRRTSLENLTSEERIIVRKCRIIAGQTIMDIDATCRDELIAGWNAVWLMYQAVMVPLISLYSYLTAAESTAGDGTTAEETKSSEDVDEWRKQIETAMRFFDRMQRFSVAARKSRDVVERLYAGTWHISEMIKRRSEGNVSQGEQSQSQVQEQSHPEHQYDPTTSQSQAPAKDQASNPQTLSYGFSDPPQINNQEFANDQEILDPFGLGAGDPAMNSFWDDMMWDTFPELQDTSGESDALAAFFPGFSGFERPEMDPSNDN